METAVLRQREGLVTWRLVFDSDVYAYVTIVRGEDDDDVIIDIASAKVWTDPDSFVHIQLCSRQAPPVDPVLILRRIVPEVVPLATRILASPSEAELLIFLDWLQEQHTSLLRRAGFRLQR